MLKRSEIRKRDAVIVEELMQGRTYEFIGNQFGVTRARIGQIAERNEINKRRINRIFRKKFVRDVKLLIKNGKSIEEIAKIYDVNISTVYSWGRIHKIELPYYKVRPEFSTRFCKGYVKIKLNGKWIWRSRWKMEDVLKRKLKSTERIYHKNGNKKDDRINNLVVIDRTGWK